jgi:hypothetical protein
MKGVIITIRRASLASSGRLPSKRPQTPVTSLGRDLALNCPGRDTRSRHPPPPVTVCNAMHLRITDKGAGPPHVASRCRHPAMKYAISARHGGVESGDRAYNGCVFPSSSERGRPRRFLCNPADDVHGSPELLCGLLGGLVGVCSRHDLHHLREYHHRA